MSRYIDADELLTHVKDLRINTAEGYEFRHRCIDPQYVYDAPTADVVPVVRCKDCGFFEVNHFDKVADLDNMPLITAHNICRRWGNGCQTSPDGFCFMGISKKVSE